MLKNLNDYASFGFLLVICGFCIRLFIGNLTEHRNDDTPRSKRRQMVKNFTDNEEE